MRTTQKDIAGHLNLSASLVGKVLNGSPNVWASGETRDRILRAAREMSYRPNAAARALRRGTANTVAFVTVAGDSHSHQSGANAVEVLAAALADLDQGLLIKTCRDPQVLLGRVGDLARTGTCDAFILWDDEENVEPLGVLLEQLGVPFVIKGYHEQRHPGWLQFEFDHQHMMTQAVAHLAALGHRRIAYIGFEGAQVFVRRLEDGYRAAMHALLGRPAREDYLARMDASSEGAELQMERWLALDGPEAPTAVVVGAGNGAWQGIEAALARRGRRIGDAPGELAVAGESHGNFRLLFGDALGYAHVEQSDLARAVAAELLSPLLAGRRPHPVVRVCPQLQPLATYGLAPAFESFSQACLTKTSNCVNLI